MASTPSPKDLAKILLPDEAAKMRRHAANIENARAEGRMEGRSEARKEYMDWLEKRYLQPDVERGGSVGIAILTIAKEMGEHFRADVVRKHRGSGR